MSVASFFDYRLNVRACGKNQIRTGRHRRTDFADKAISATRHGLNVVLAVRCLAKSFPQQVDVLGKIAFLDHAIRPDDFYQVVFFQQLTAVRYQRDQDFYGLWS